MTGITDRAEQCLAARFQHPQAGVSAEGLRTLLQEDCIIPDAVGINPILYCNMNTAKPFLHSKSLQPQQQQELKPPSRDVQIQYMFYHYSADICFV